MKQKAFFIVFEGLSFGEQNKNLVKIAGTNFNNYFASIAETTKKNIKYTHKQFSDHLSNECDSAIFLQPT